MCPAHPRLSGKPADANRDRRGRSQRKPGKRKTWASGSGGLREPGGIPEVGFLNRVSFEQVCKVRKGLEEKRRHITPAFIQETLLQPLKHQFDVLVVHILMHTKMDM